MPVQAKGSSGGRGDNHISAIAGLAKVTFPTAEACDITRHQANSDEGMSQSASTELFVVKPTCRANAYIVIRVAK